MEPKDQTLYKCFAITSVMHWEAVHPGEAVHWLIYAGVMHYTESSMKPAQGMIKATASEPLPCVNRFPVDDVTISYMFNNFDY